MSDSGRTRGKGCLGFIALCVIAGIVGGIVFTLWQRTQDDDLRTRWQARGLPTSMQELDAWYESVPDEENAALEFMAASDTFARVLTEEEKHLPYVGGSESRTTNFELTDATLATAQDFLRKNAAAYELAHNAAKLPRARYPFNGNLGPSGVDMQHLAHVRNVARHLWLEALVRAQENNAEGAVASIEAAYALAETVDDEPILIAQLVAIAVKHGTAQAASDVISATRFTPEQLDRMAHLAAESSGRDGYYRAMAGEAAFGLFDTSARNPMANPVFVFDRRAYGRFMETLLDTSALPLHEAIPRVEALSDSQPRKLSYYLRPMSSSMAPSLARSFDAVARAAIFGELLQLVLAVEKYRLTNSALPDDLAQLAPEFIAEVSQDPYGGAPYKYLRQGETYAVYSVGPNRADDKAAKITGTGGDIALHVSR